MIKLTTTLNKIQGHNPCKNGWDDLISHLGKDFDRDEDINLLTILAANGVQDCLWSLRATKQNSERCASGIVAECARRVLHIFENKYLDDKRPRLAIEAAEAWTVDPSEKNRIAAYAAANAAANAAADADANAAYAAANAAAYAAAVAAANAAAAVAANAAAYAANAADAAVAVNAAANSYARKEELTAQTKIIKKYLAW